jgi:hypothetical protein
MQRVGMPQGPIISMFRSLQQLKHFVRTAHGDSTTFFESNDVHPVAIQGVGQGNGAGPQIWALISTVILNMLRTEGWGASFTSPIDRREIQFVGYSFVDDTDLIVANQGKWENATEVLQALQAAMEEWEGGLRATGGALEPSKTFYYLVDFLWDKGKWSYNTTPASTELQIRNLDGQMQPVEQVPVSEARRTLGVKLAPDGNNDAEFESLRQKAQVWASNVTAHQLSRKYAWQSLQTTITAQLSYPLPATTLSESQCSEIDMIIRKTALPSSGIMRTFPLDLAYSPESRQGLGMFGLYDRQGVAGILAIIKYCNDPFHLVRKQLAISLELLTIEIGHNSPVLQLSYPEWGCLATDSYLKHIWKFADKRAINISGPTHSAILREGDCYLMPSFATIYPAAVLQRLNRCRMFLQVLTIAEIVSTDGKDFTDQGWNGAKGDKPGWPNQGTLPSREWNLWREALRKTFGTRNDASPRELAQPLGEWTSAQDHEWWFNRSFNKIYRQSDHVTAYKAIEQRARRSQAGTFQRDTREAFIPVGSEPATVTRAGEVWILRGYSSQRITQHTLPDAWWQDRRQHEPRDGGESIIEKIVQGTAKAVADGSFKDGWGTASGIVTGSSSINDLSIDVITPGLAADQCSFRSEVAGLLAIVRSVNELLTQHGVTTGSITVACDNEAAVRAANNKTGGVNPNASHFDLVTAVRRHVLDSPIQWQFIHVKGHATGSLDDWEQLNHNMDTACKQYWKQTEQHRSPVQDFEQREWAAWVGPKKIASSARSTLREWIQHERANTYWNRRLSTAANAGIDWNATAGAMSRLPASRRTWVSKQSSSSFAFGVRMQSRDERITSKCPCCAETETAEHILRCQQPASTAKWDKMVEELQEWMTQEDSDPSLQADLVDGLYRWRQLSQDDAKSYKTNTADIPESLRLLGERSPTAAAQTAIGWRSAMEGRLATQWRAQQDQYWSQQNRTKSSKKWIVSLSFKLINMTWELWQHRNDTLHRTETRVADEVLDSRITVLYERGVNHLPEPTHRFFRPLLPEILSRRPQQKLDWAVSVEAATAKAASQHRRLRGSRQIMESFIRNAQQPPTSTTQPRAVQQESSPPSEQPTEHRDNTPTALFPIFRQRTRTTEITAPTREQGHEPPTPALPLYPIF